MKAVISTESMNEAIGLLGQVVPRRSPKPVLQNLRLQIHDGHRATLEATDLEVGLRVPLDVVSDEGPAVVLLTADRTSAILRTAKDESFTVETPRPSGLLPDEGEAVPSTIRIKAGPGRFDLPTEDPDHYPTWSGKESDAALAVVGRDLGRALAATIAATDPESTRYALGGIKLEVEDGKLLVVATDGRRLHAATITLLRADLELPASSTVVVPIKAAKLIARLADRAGDAECLISFDKQMVYAMFGEAMLFARLVEGRFPRWRDVEPGGEPRITLNLPGPGPFAAAINQAQITTSDESRTVEIELGPPDQVIAWAVAADVGSSHVDFALDGVAIDRTERIGVDPRYIKDALAPIGPDQAVTIEFRGDKSPLCVRADGFRAIVMPLTSDSNKPSRLRPAASAAV